MSSPYSCTCMVQGQTTIKHKQLVGMDKLLQPVPSPSQVTRYPTPVIHQPAARQADIAQCLSVCLSICVCVCACVRVHVRVRHRHSADTAVYCGMVGQHCRVTQTDVLTASGAQGRACV